MNRLQKSLTINAVFSIISGVLSLLFKSQLTTLFDLSNELIFVILGIGLLIFASSVLLEVIKQRKIFVGFIILQDGLWVIGSMLLLYFQPFGISSIGNLLIALVALCVLLIGLNQYNALKSRN